jgi:argininosuccinate synthase
VTVPNHWTFDEGSSSYDQCDAAGFIKLNALRLRIGARRAKQDS